MRANYTAASDKKESVTVYLKVAMNDQILTIYNLDKLESLKVIFDSLKRTFNIEVPEIKENPTRDQIIKRNKNINEFFVNCIGSNNENIQKMTFDYLSEHSDEDGKKIIKRLKVKSNWKSA